MAALGSKDTWDEDGRCQLVPALLALLLGRTLAPVSKGITLPLPEKAERCCPGLTELTGWYSLPYLLINSQD